MVRRNQSIQFKLKYKYKFKYNGTQINSYQQLMKYVILLTITLKIVALTMRKQMVSANISALVQSCFLHILLVWQMDFVQMFNCLITTYFHFIFLKTFIPHREKLISTQNQQSDKLVGNGLKVGFSPSKKSFYSLL